VAADQIGYPKPAVGDRRKGSVPAVSVSTALRCRGAHSRGRLNCDLTFVAGLRSTQGLPLHTSTLIGLRDGQTKACDKSGHRPILHHPDLSPKNQQTPNLTACVGSQQRENEFGKIRSRSRDFRELCFCIPAADLMRMDVAARGQRRGRAMARSTQLLDLTCDAPEK
jgi:hypothetical protein